MNPRRGQHTPHHIAGDRADLAGFPRLVEEFATWMGVHGYSPATIENRRTMLGYLVDWLADRGITRPVEVTRPQLESYQRWLFVSYRKPDGDPLSFRSQSQRCWRCGRSSSGPPANATCCTTPPRRSSSHEPNAACPNPG